MKMVLAYVTAKDKAEAEKLAQGLLENRLVGCVNVFDRMTSLFWWEGKIEQSNEAVLILKTRADKIDEVEAWIRSAHSYDCPCVLFLPIEKGSSDYIKWLNQELVTPIK